MSTYKVVEEFTPADLRVEKRQEIIDNLKRGDIVAFYSLEDAYRNDGKAIFDGQDIVDLYYEEDDYGSIPPTFLVGDEFPIMHWKDNIDHNNIVWINPVGREDQLLDLSVIAGDTYHTTIVQFPLGTYTIRVDNTGEYGDSIQEYGDEVLSGKPVPLGAIDDSTMIYPWVAAF